MKTTKDGGLTAVDRGAGAPGQQGNNEMDNTTRREAPQATVENVTVALHAIAAMAARRRLVLDGPDAAPFVPEFESKKQAQKFRNRLGRAMRRPGMRSANVFLGYFGEARVRYSDKEEAIRTKRKALVAAVKAAAEARRAYLLEKGDFYGGRVRVSAEAPKP